METTLQKFNSFGLSEKCLRAQGQNRATSNVLGCALSQVQGSPHYPRSVECMDEYQFVECLLPATSIFMPPKHEHYLTFTSWQPLKDPSNWLRPGSDTGSPPWSLT
uniref:Uncharacterized protein n=1 Tax=Piliocolobus tephrosceles TaxID=591936 RepID=A0A8C9HDG7_9PRIM